MNRSRSAGFTLPEVMAALAVFAVIAAMAYGGLSTLLTTRQEGARRLGELAALEMFFTSLARDVEQAVARPVTGGQNRRLPAMVGNQETLIFLELTRTGRPNPRDADQSALERLAWSLEEGRILRRTWESLDRILDEPPAGEILLEGVRGLEIRFLGGDGAWRTFWPPTPDRLEMLPRAVEIVVERVGWGRLRRLFEVAGGG
ncbi:MAG: type II secretion system minor pseudopilin GspJ [Magnetococcales bacterium]|nr:type II secretion system minor pseudopilin GspJ [Magnetococcales bacterium]